MPVSAWKPYLSGLTVEVGVLGGEEQNCGVPMCARSDLPVRSDAAASILKLLR
jgi:hypothetical protein